MNDPLCGASGNQISLAGLGDRARREITLWRALGLFLVRLLESEIAAITSRSQLRTSATTPGNRGQRNQPERYGHLLRVYRRPVETTMWVPPSRISLCGSTIWCVIWQLPPTPQDTPCPCAHSGSRVGRGLPDGFTPHRGHHYGQTPGKTSAPPLKPDLATVGGSAVLRHCIQPHRSSSGLHGRLRLQIRPAVPS